MLCEDLEFLASGSPEQCFTAIEEHGRELTGAYSRLKHDVEFVRLSSMAGFTLRPFKGCLEVFCWLSRVYLTHTVTHEVIELPSAFRDQCSLEWSLEEDPFLLAPSTGATQWCHELFSRFWITDETGKECIRVRREQGNLNEDLPCRLSPFEYAGVSFRLSAGGPCKVTVLAQNLPINGNFLWRNLPEIFKLAGGTTEWGKVREKRWKAWSGHLEDAGLASDALLKGLRKEGAADTSASSPAPWASASTHALLHLLLRWSSSFPVKGRLEEVADGAKSVLEALLRRLPEELQLEFPERKSEFCSPYVVRGEQKLTLLLRDGRVDLAHFQGKHPDAMMLHFASFAGQKECSLLDLLSSFPIVKDYASQDWSLLPQILWLLGSHMEASFIGLSPVKMSSGKWFEESRLELEVVPEHYRGSALRAYNEQSMSHIGDADVLSVALDDSRLGRRPCKVVAVSDGTNAYWCCPQAGQRYSPPCL